MMKRTAEGYLETWIEKKRRKPLILRGARQTGKSTLVRMFASKKGLLLNEINLEQHLYLDDVFKTLDINNIIRELEAVVGSNLQHPGSLLFLDEIQATPHALQALRYFFEDKPGIPVIAAGSLLEFTLSNHSFSMPVGRIEYYHIGPMTFKEFLHEIDSSLLKHITQFDFSNKIPETAHKKLLKKQREYFFTGGMPEAVLVYTENGSVTEVIDVQRSIVETYLDDFSKYGRQIDLPLMQKIFRYIPRTLGKKVKYSNIAKEKKSANAEVDYVISQANKVLPVEVKSGKSGSLKSLQQFVLKKNNNTAIRFDLNLPTIQDVSHITATSDGNKPVNYKLVSLPLYMVEELPRLIDCLL